MKRYLLFTTLLLMMLCTISCRKEKISYQQSSDRGSLSLKGLTVEVERRPLSRESSGKQRMSGSDIAAFQVLIHRQAPGEEKEVFRGTVGTLPELLELPTGSYSLTIASAPTPEAAFETPIYSDKQPFEIVKDQLTYINKAVCRLSNIGVKITLDKALQAAISGALNTTCTIGKGSLTFTKEEQRIGYFAAAEKENFLTAEIEGEIKGEKINMKYPFAESLIAGEVKTIHLTLKTLKNKPDDGSTSISYSIDASLVDNNIDKTISLGDEEVIDSSSPLIFMEGITSDSIPLSTAEPYNATANIHFKTQNGVDMLLLKIDGPSTLLSAPLLKSLLNNEKCIDLTKDENKESLKKIGFTPSGSTLLTTAQISYSLRPLFDFLSQYSGKHRIAFLLRGKQGKEVARHLKLYVADTPPAPVEDSPRFVGDLFDAPIPLKLGSQEKVPVEFKVEAHHGIRSFQVAVTSSSSDGIATLMDTLPFTSRFDLCRLSDEASDALRGFGLPTREQVENKKSLHFSLTEFTNMISAFPGTTKFTFTIIDHNDKRASKAITFEVK